MLKQLRPALVLLVLLTIVTGGLYPALITGIAQAAFPDQANGSLVTKGGVVVGSHLIGQNFTSPAYFHGRPSATTDTDPADPTKTIPSPYKADASGASNLGPTSAVLMERVKADAAALRSSPETPIPVDLVTASASGLDPDITPAAALFQAERVAKARKLPLTAVKALIEAETVPRLFGVLGESHVNVLALNLALDKMAAAQ